MAGRRVSSRGENVAEVVRLDRGAERSFAECRGAFQPCDFGGRVETLTRMHGLTIFIFLNSSIGVAAGLNFFVLRIRLEPSADTSGRRPASKRGEDRTAARAIGYIIASLYVCNRALVVCIIRSVPAFRTLPRKNRARESAASFLPSRRFCWAQVQTGGAITAEPYACRPIIKIIESQENRLPSDNLYSDYRKSG